MTLSVRPHRFYHDVPPSSEGTIFTAPDDRTYVVRRITAANTTGVAAGISLKVGGKAIFGSHSVAANSEVDKEVADPLLVGETIRATNHTANAITLLITGFSMDLVTVVIPTVVALVEIAEASAPQGGSIHLSGSGYGAGETVNLSIDGGGTLSPASAVANSSGAFSAAVVVSSSTNTGTRTVTATGATTGRSDTDTLSVTAPPSPQTASISVSPTTVNQGGSVTVSGLNFGASETVNLIIDAGGSLAPSAATSSASGSFSQGVVIPAGTPPGTRRITATGATSGRSAHFDITVTGSTPPPGGPQNSGGNYTDWFFPVVAPGRGFYNIDWFMRMEKVDPDDAKLFWSNQFIFKDVADRSNGKGAGYFGVQASGSPPAPDQKLIVVSLWGAIDASGPSYVAPFEEFGAGYSVRRPYSWVEGRDYRLRMWTTSSDSSGTWWGFWVHDMTSDPGGNNSAFDTYIGSIKVPAAWGFLDGGPDTTHYYSITFTEYFGPQQQLCSQYPSARVYIRPAADEGAYPASSHNNHVNAAGTCGFATFAEPGDGGVKQLFGPSPN